MSAWLPNGKLEDGTLLFGPLKEKPTADLGRYIEFQFRGETWYIVHSGGELSPQQTSEAAAWGEKALSSQAQ